MLVDIFQGDAAWASWSLNTLVNSSSPRRIAPVVYAELSAGFLDQPELDRELSRLRIATSDPSSSALFIAGCAYADYRSRGGTREHVLPDFLIGAQAFDEAAALITRDPRRYRTAFPDLKLTSP